MFFGFEKTRRSKSYILLAEPEKALIDGLYLGLIPENMARELMANGMDKNKISEMLGRINFKGVKKIRRQLCD